MLPFLLGSSDETARIQPWNPDSSISFDLPVNAVFEATTSAPQGALVALVSKKDPGSVVTVSFTPGTKPGSLSDHIREGHKLLLEVVPNKRVEPMRSPALEHAFRGWHYPFVAFSYPSSPRLGDKGSICDAVAVHWQTPGGIWSVSANGDLGKGTEIQAVLERFVTSCRLQDLTTLAQIKPAKSALAGEKRTKPSAP